MSATDQFVMTWIDGGREPQCPPNPEFPNGKDIDGSLGQKDTCTVSLPYPAKRCGVHIVMCRVCGLRIGVTAAGRPDDPRSIRMPCKAIARNA